MINPNDQQAQEPENERMPSAPTGNASNPSANDEAPAGEHQLLGSRAEKYLRESASIEDLPDDEDWQDANEELKDQ